MRLELLAKVLQDADLGTIGQDIFVHRMDAETESGILLRGPLTGIPADPSLPDYYKADIQAIIRDPDQYTGDAKSLKITRALTMYRRKFYDYDGTLLMSVKHIYLCKLPIVYLRSVGRSIEWSLNFRTAYVMPS